MTLKIGTYNIKNAGGGNDIKTIADEIKSHKLDIVGLQELDLYTCRVGEHDLLSEIADLAGYPYKIFGHTIDFGGGEYGIGILSKFGPAEFEVVPLPSGPEQRVFIRAVFNIGGEKLNFFNTHLSLEDDYRAIQLKLLSEETDSRRPFVLTGDFNVDSLSEFDIFKNCYCANNQSHPFITFKPGTAIDNIIVSGDLKLSNVFMHESQSSDHNMLIGAIKN